MAKDFTTFFGVVFLPVQVGIFSLRSLFFQVAWTKDVCLIVEFLFDLLLVRRVSFFCLQGCEVL